MAQTADMGFLSANQCLKIFWSAVAPILTGTGQMHDMFKPAWIVHNHCVMDNSGCKHDLLPEIIRNPAAM